MASRLAQRHTGADFEAGARVALDTAQLLEVTEPDQNLRIELTPLEVREEVCAAGDKHRRKAVQGRWSRRGSSRSLVCLGKWATCTRASRATCGGPCGTPAPP